MTKIIKKKVSRIKTKKKTWFKILAPELFGKKEIGETYLSSIEKAVGRIMKINLRDLTGNVRDQNAYIKFRITPASGSNLQTTTIGYALTPAFVKRLVRKNTTRLDDCFRLKTKDGKNVTLKSLLVTLHKTQRSTKTQLRNKLKELLQKEISRGAFDAFVQDTITNKIQSGLKRKLHKVYPLKEVAVRVLALQEEKEPFPVTEAGTEKVKETT